MRSHERRSIREARALEIVKSICPPAVSRPVGLTGRDLEIQEILEQPSHVYFIYSAGRVKIGYSTNWRSRTEAVCQGCPHHAELILVMPGDMKLERGYQALFHEYRESGEWFRCDGKMREFLYKFASETGREILEMAELDFADSLTKGDH